MDIYDKAPKELHEAFEKAHSMGFDLMSNDEKERKRINDFLAEYPAQIDIDNPAKFAAQASFCLMVEMGLLSRT